MSRFKKRPKFEKGGKVLLDLGLHYNETTITDRWWSKTQLTWVYTVETRITTMLNTSDHRQI